MTATLLLDCSLSMKGDRLAAALQGAVNYWQNDEHDEARQMLNHALELAKAANYL